MTHIKRLSMKGFKSFARETVLTMDRHMNTIVGPNGSGKSNITDALCFVLGRLSIKSIRAAKAAHLIFSGNKEYKPATIAYVEIVFDNEDKTFALDTQEIIIRRIVKKSGGSIYKINDQTKTRQEVLELLSQAGIDPHGFNIILQGEIQRFVEMSAEERRNVIEEIAGISVYEMRKTKSLRELDKTHEKLKQVNAVLRERTNYLKNLENEREQALKYQKLQDSVKRCRASILVKNVQIKDKELKDVNEKLELFNKEISKKDAEIKKTQDEISRLNQTIDEISKTIQKSSGFEQDSLLNEITELKQEIAGLIARKENYENNLNGLERRNQTLQESIKTAEQEIQEMTKQKGKNKKQELEEKKAKLEELEETKRKLYLFKSNLSSLNTQIEDKKRQLQSQKIESNYLLSQIEDTEREIKIKEPLEQQKNKLIELKSSIEKNKAHLSDSELLVLEKEKILAVNSHSIKDAEEVKNQVSKLDICPLCQTKITKEHIAHVLENSNRQISEAEKTIRETQKELKEIEEKIKTIKETINSQHSEINIREICIIKLQTISERKQQLKRLSVQIKSIDDEIKDLETKKKSLETKLSSVKISEEQYENLKLEVNELHRTEERNLGVEITSKQRELDRTRLAIKQILRDREDIEEELKEIGENLESKQEQSEEKEKQADILKKKYQKMFEQKNELQDKTRVLETQLLGLQNDKRNKESESNNTKIIIAQINARVDTLNEELKEFKNTEIINLPVDKLKQRLEFSEIQLSRIGSVNLRALEVYDGIKEEYEKIREKVEQLEKEEQEILTVIAQIDRKKKKTFMSTLEEINNLFSRNFSQLSVKGIVTIEPQDQKEIFNAGLDIIVKTGPGKRFDVTSLSGGEQTLVALSLIFAIQEYSPYCFYIFDEIDAALDRRNSEKLAYLLKKHMKQGQYLIITHNDSIISESTNSLYGVSMQEGISKVLSLVL